MKKIFAVIPLLAMLVLPSCSQEIKGVKATFTEDDCREIHFTQSSMEKSFAKDAKEGEFVVTLGRLGNKGTYKVTLDITGSDQSLFTFNSEVTIPDGSYSVELPVYVDMSSVVPGSDVSASLFISGRDASLGENSAYISQYSDFIKLTASFELEWEACMRTTEEGETVQQTATYYYNLFYTGVQSEMLVEQAVGSPNIYRLLDWAGGVGFIFKLNSDNSVTVPGQSIGYYYESSAEYVYVADVAQYLGDDSYYSYYPCTFDGDRTFTLNLVYYVTDGIFDVGTEKIVFAGDHDNDPAMTASYLGDGKFSFLYNEYVTNCKAVVVSGDISEDSAAVAEIVKSISLGTCEGVRSFLSDEQSWEPEDVVNTLIAVPFDAEGKAGSAVALRFTYDPQGKYTPQINLISLAPLDKDPRSTLEFRLQTENAAKIDYLLLTADVLDYYMGYYDADYILDRIGNSFDEETLAQANSAEGVTLYLYNLDEGNEYGLLMRVTNKYGDSISRNVSAKLESAADNFLPASLEDFTGSYLTSALVTTTDDSTGSTETFRTDIISLSGNKVLVKGLCNYANYSPELTGYYDEENHCIRLNSQNLGDFSYMTVVFGFVGNLYTGIWGQTSSLEFGFCDDGYVHWRTTPGSEMQLTGYKFLLFDGSSYSGYAVGDKTYTQLLMKKL